METRRRGSRSGGASTSDGRVEFIKDRLVYKVIAGAWPSDTAKEHYFSTDDHLLYNGFYKDFGPINLGGTFKFCQILHKKLSDPKYKNQQIVYFSNSEMTKRANSLVLICTFAVLYLGMTPEDACAPVASVIRGKGFLFHDASPLECTFILTVYDIVRGIAAARDSSFFSFKSFDVAEYDHYEKVENGDMNWLVYRKFLAFAGPHNASTTKIYGEMVYTKTPEDYVPYFKKNNVQVVVRLNQAYYDAKRFTSKGIKHVDLYFPDGSCPPEDILQSFLLLCESTPGAIAVHCKAGLGRTGSVIAAYLMKHHKLLAKDLIGWFRVCRPGSVIGPQQQYLEEIQERMWREGDAYRERKGLKPIPDPTIINLDYYVPGGGMTGVSREERKVGDTSDAAVSTLVKTLSITSTTSSATTTGLTARGATPLSRGSRDGLAVPPKYAEEEKLHTAVDDRGYSQGDRLLRARRTSPTASSSGPSYASGGAGATVPAGRYAAPVGAPRPRAAVTETATSTTHVRITRSDSGRVRAVPSPARSPIAASSRRPSR